MQEASTAGITPMLKQYWQIKSEIADSDTILFFRLGDFYEMFFDDAKTASTILDITLTSRNKNDPNPVPLCGIPYHAADGYIARLLSSGKKVAICEQVEDPKTAKGVVRREIVKIITPGVLMEADSLVAGQNNYLMAISPAVIASPPEAGETISCSGDRCVGFSTSSKPPSAKKPAERRDDKPSSKMAVSGGFALAACDASTGELWATVLKDISVLAQEFCRLEPREVIIPRSLSDDQIFLRLKPIFERALITVLDDPNFDATLIGNISSDGVAKEALASVGAVVSYLKRTQKAPLTHIRRATPYHVSEFMVIDEATKRNLELTRTIADGSVYGTLIWLIDKTRTAMGARTIRRWMFYPLVSKDKICERQAAVEAVKDDFALAETLKAELQKIADIERITSRVVMGSANARELNALKDSLKNLPKIKEFLSGCHPRPRLNHSGVNSGGDPVNAGDSRFRGNDMSTHLLDNIRSKIDVCEELAAQIEATLADEPPLSVKDGGLVRRGISAELDDLRSLATDGKGFISRLEASEKERTGISSLKVRFNKVFGYYIEVTHTHTDKIPENYIRKQTLTNAERYITPELKTYEEKVLGAEERIRQLEYEIFSELRGAASSFAGRLADTADAIGELDGVASLASLANQNRYCRPEMTDDGSLHIKDGRHPIIEQLNPTERFVPNDVDLDMEQCRMMMITGPNMAGKSTVMRQTALIVLLAQMGSFVPASEAKIGIVDRIFTRVGASDDLVRGQSTFMVEMNEAAAILKEATSKSLVLIDEIGRGTSTYDGVSIAWAVAEYLHDRSCAKTLFATHYHELTDLALTKEGIKNFNVAVKEWNDQIVFLRKLVSGGVNRSYGIQVARLAGLPADVIARAKEILVKLEKGEMVLRGESSRQMRLFDPAPPAVEEGNTEIVEGLKNIDTSVLTPIEALNLVHRLKQKMGE